MKVRSRLAAPDVPVGREDVDRIVHDRIDLLDASAELDEGAGSAGHQIGDLGLNVGEAERRTERDPEPAYAVLETDPVVAAVVGQGEPVAAVGQGQHIEHESRHR